MIIDFKRLVLFTYKILKNEAFDRCLPPQNAISEHSSFQKNSGFPFTEKKEGGEELRGKISGLMGAQILKKMPVT